MLQHCWLLRPVASSDLTCRHKGALYAGATRLALALGAGTSAEAQQSVGQRFIIVETNYRVRCLLNCLHLLWSCQ